MLDADADRADLELWLIKLSLEDRARVHSFAGNGGSGAKRAVGRKLRGINPPAAVLVLITGYILIGIRLEERDLFQQFGDQYRRYRNTSCFRGGKFAAPTSSARHVSRQINEPAASACASNFAAAHNSKYMH